MLRLPSSHTTEQPLPVQPVGVRLCLVGFGIITVNRLHKKTPKKGGTLCFVENKCADMRFCDRGCRINLRGGRAKPTNCRWHVINRGDTHVSRCATHTPTHPGSSSSELLSVIRDSHTTGAFLPVHQTSCENKSRGLARELVALETAAFHRWRSTSWFVPAPTPPCACPCPHSPPPNAPPPRSSSVAAASANPP